MGGFGQRGLRVSPEGGERQSSVPWGGFGTHGGERVEGPGCAVSTVPKVRDLPGFKSGGTKALHHALLVGFASCWGLFIVYSAFAG